MDSEISYWRDRLTAIRAQCARTESIEQLIRLNVEAERCMYEICKASGQ